jgi:hypothetical protein
MRSCSSSVLVHESVEQVAPVDLGRRILASEGRFDSWIRRLQPERPVWAMGVVVLDVDPQHLLEVAAADNQQPVQALGADRPDPAFGVGVGVGRLHRRDQHLNAVRPEHVVEGARELRVAVVQDEAQPPFSSPSTTSRLRACWVTQPLLGLAVTPARWTRRVSSSMKNSTYSRRNQVVSTVKKSHATIPAACWRRNARQVVAVDRGAGSSP